MADDWSFIQIESGNHKEYTELYERTREATREAQRQGDAQLKAAMAAATAAPVDRVCICPLSLAFSKAGLEKAYRQKSSLSADKKDVFLIVFQFLFRTTVLFLLVQNQGSKSIADEKTSTGVALTRLVWCLWIAALCVTMLSMQFQCPSWHQGRRSIILLLAFCFLWFGEVAAVSAPGWDTALDLAHMVSQCIISSVLHRVPFSLHYKTRLFGFGLQMFWTLTMAAQVEEAVPFIIFFSMSHFLGVALAYISDQQSRFGFLNLIPYFGAAKIVGDSQISTLQAPKRALGGFAGGFGGVSSLKCPYPPSIWTVLSSSYADSSSEDCGSEVSCRSSSTVENSTKGFSARRRYLSCVSSSNKDTTHSSDTLCSASSGLEFNVYWQFKAATRGGCDG